MFKFNPISGNFDLVNQNVKQYANLAGFPVIGNTQTLYIALDSSVLYFWDGVSYVANQLVGIKPLLFSQITTLTYGNVITENNLLSAYSIAANTPVIGTSISINISGLISRGSASSTFKFYIGGVLVASTNAINLNNGTLEGFDINLKATFRTIGATANVMAGGNAACFNDKNFIFRNNAGSITANVVNSTAAMAIRVTHQFNANNAANSVNVLAGTITLNKL